MSTENQSQETSKQTRELIREILDLPDGEKVRVFTSLREDLDSQGNLLEEHQTDQLNQRMKDALDAFAAVRKYLDLSDDETRQLTIKKYNDAQVELGLDFNARKVVTAFDDSWDLVKKVALGGRLPVSKAQRWRRNSVSRRGRLNQRHIAGLRIWLSSNPPNKTRTRYDKWRKDYNRDNEGLQPLLVTSQAILQATSKSWKVLVREAEHSSSNTDAQRDEVIDATDLSRSRATPQMMNPEEVAVFLNVEIEQVLKWIEADKIPFVELPTSGVPIYRIPTSALTASLGGKYKLFSEVSQVRPEKLLYDKALVAQRVTEAREAFGWTKAELARRAGLDPSHLSRIESLDHRELAIASIVRLAIAFQVSTDYFLSPYEELPK